MNNDALNKTVTQKVVTKLDLDALAEELAPEIIKEIKKHVKDGFYFEFDPSSKFYGALNKKFEDKILATIKV